uniref:Uncharacterized protein n=1 Tax=Grammatophora oceanica TaxID=210454 RepID=A0A7S1UTK2_9STRA|mmetsp:Transcript_21863/g.32536  ORF Transcript_21863/g.32536 Transcript_21863/m.32536 type:complete len:372 (+) Transcript_21863:214-1329(+)|eukprot:CAMPEP_0194040336 /NCGR_PEP_ID=MMETSP0009_2-20130614/12362_1 /TAXON_ID=210454 /ORGANISM="Grammatophora oceanica, Strain CCMP 410" /LENGTH=371 /DNA_ID=CAMNT_0038683451 /DNA_START=158 /DNA_END=1273 /DNA_ORIENTATION=+
MTKLLSCGHISVCVFISCLVVTGIRFYIGPAAVGHFTDVVTKSDDEPKVSKDEPSDASPKADGEYKNDVSAADDEEPLFAATGIYSSLLLPLKPPYHLVQVGAPRTGSTFQSRLLLAILNLKTPPILEEIGDDDGNNKTEGFIKSFVMGQGHNQKHHYLKLDHPEFSLVGKSHDFRQSKTNWTDFVSTSNFDWIVFSSSDYITEHLMTYSLYNQRREDLQECSLCEVDKYQPIFGLTDEEVETLKTYMHLFEQLRLCCAAQMSRYNIMRLNGCNMTEYLDEPDYPHCEDMDLEKVEKEFSELPLFRDGVSHSSEYTWGKPGDCAKSEAKMKGTTFNYRKRFPGCLEALNRNIHSREKYGMNVSTVVTKSDQ